MVRLRLIHDRTGEGKAEKEYLIQIEIYQYSRAAKKATKKYITTDVYCKPGHWNGARVENHPRARELNTRLNGKMKPIEDFIYNEGDLFTFEKLEQFLDGKYRHSLNGFIKSNLENLSDTKRRQHLTMLDHLTTHAGEVQFRDVNQDFIEGFDRYLRNTMKFMESTAYGYLKYLKSHTNRAFKKGYLKEDPFLDFKLKVVRYETVKYLEQSELDLIENYDLSRHKSLERVRDFFIFCCYTGLSYQDAAAFTKDDIVEVHGQLMIKKARIKTEEPFRIVLFPQAVEILKKYNYTLPVISHDKTNKYIKEVAFLAGVEKNITAHMARHTCAVMLLNNGVSMEIVSQWLGHSSTRITEQVYGKFTDSTIIELALTAMKNINK